MKIMSVKRGDEHLSANLLSGKDGHCSSVHYVRVVTKVWTEKISTSSINKLLS